MSAPADDRRWLSLKTVARDVGALQMLVSGAMLLPLLVSLLYGEMFSALGFLVAATTTATAGAILYYVCRNAEDPERHHAMIIAGFGWLMSALFGALPFLLTAWWTPASVAQTFVPDGETYASSLFVFRNPLHAFFESMSGFTTTGFTMVTHEPSIGHGLLFYRSLTQWIGGAGVIVLSLAIIPRPRAIGGVELYQSESTATRLRPSILGTARAIWKIYGTLTLLLVAYLFIGTVLVLPDYGVARTLFNSVNHAMTGVATGGFSTLDDSIASYGSYALELIHIPAMLVGAVAFPLYYVFFRQRDFRIFWRDPQFRLMLLIFAIIIPVLTLLLVGDPAVGDPFRESLFQTIAALTSTGWQTSSIGDWNAAAILLLATCTMIVSGAAGSTTGGTKLIRLYVLARSITWRIRKVFLHPSAIVPFRIGPRQLPSHAMQREVADAAVLTFAYLIILLFSLLIVVHLAAPEFTPAQAMFESISAQGTIGLSVGMIQPGMPAAIELLFIFQMWIGRLEIFPVLVLIHAVISWMLRR
jgi:trk system potassium uptake protein